MKDKILKEAPLNLAMVKELLEGIKKNGVLNFRAQKTLEHAETARFSASQAKVLVEKLMKLEIPRFKEIYCHKLVDTAPTTSDEVKTVLSGYNLTLTKEHIQQIADTIASSKPKQ
ncbi:hypothetical protein HY486_02025 [Candidatus Woesearchaeota archaeon]|nr:hypothetical protein [Candidatus Woesearchaeota archaeon]